MATPGAAADFDSSTGLVRALAAALHGCPHRRLGRPRSTAAAVRLSAAVPEAWRTRIFAATGAMEGIPPERLDQVSADAFAAWVTGQYGPRRAPAIAIGSSNGAVMHLCAAMGIPWLPQSFLVPVRRRSDPDDCVSDVELAREPATRLLAAQPGLQIHQMHDPNQDRLMVSRIAYFRMKLRRLPTAYRDYIRATLPHGGTILVVDCAQRWPVTIRGARHVYQHGAVGGLEAGEYDRAWTFPPVDGDAPEAEWGYEPALDADVIELAAAAGYRVVHLRFPAPDTVGPLVADIYRGWYADMGAAPTVLLAETFICVEPTWVLRARAVPLWLTFPTENSLDVLGKYLAGRNGFDDVLVTLFSHGVRSAGYAPPDHWTATGETHGVPVRLAGVRERQWPADFATLARYSAALYDRRRPVAPLPAPLALDRVERAFTEAGRAYDVEWSG